MSAPGAGALPYALSSTNAFRAARVSKPARQTAAVSCPACLRAARQPVNAHGGAASLFVLRASALSERRQHKKLETSKRGASTASGPSKGVFVREAWR